MQARAPERVIDAECVPSTTFMAFTCKWSGKNQCDAILHAMQALFQLALLAACGIAMNACHIIINHLHSLVMQD